MKLRLVKNGIFPVHTDTRANGNNTLKTGFRTPGTLQGEGKLAGIPSLFIRTTGCNLRCAWKTDDGTIDICDTPYSSHDVTEYEEWESENIVGVLEKNLGNIKHIIISGGEPCLQPLALTKTINLIKKKLDVHVSLETNGTIYVPELSWHVDFFSISPKLKSSEPDKNKNNSIANPVSKDWIDDHKSTRVNIDAIQKYINSCMHLESYYGDIPKEPEKREKKDFQLKFVIASKKDEDEIKETFLSRLGFVKPEDVLVMPLGSTPELSHKNSMLAAEMAIRNGWRFAPRIHLDLFGDVEGV
jgi:7-carboxy-7-deazaguanine synthase